MWRFNHFLLVWMQSSWVTQSTSFDFEMAKLKMASICLLGEMLLGFFPVIPSESRFSFANMLQEGGWNF